METWIVLITIHFIDLPQNRQALLTNLNPYLDIVFIQLEKGKHHTFYCHTSRTIVSFGNINI